MYQWSIETKKLPLQFTWKISRGESTEKSLFFINLQKDGHFATGEVAGITADPQKAKSLIAEFQNFKDLPFNSWQDIQNSSLPSHLKFGMTSALTHWHSQQQGQRLHEHLGLQDQTPIATSFSLPILPLAEIQPFFEKFQLQRFPVLKLKISQDQPVEACQELSRLYNGPLRIDANEAFQNSQQALAFAKAVSALNIQFIEEPLQRGSVDEYINLKQHSPLPIFADESVQSDLLSEDFKKQFHGVNIKLMKAGSYQRARQQIQQAKAWGLKIMLGCMVESSLGIAGAMTMAQDVDYFDLDGFLYFEHEPFQLVTENQGKLTYRQNPSFPLIF